MYQENNVISCFDYYQQPKSRELAHKAKNGGYKALLKIAKQMSLWIPDGSILIPTPSRDGIATDSLIIANEISRLRKVIVKDIVTGIKRDSLYDIKKSGKEVPDDFFNFSIKNNNHELCKNIYIVDTVFDTGSTTNEILKLIPNAKILTHSRVGLFDKDIVTLNKRGIQKTNSHNSEYTP
jgi:hypothetical protein